MSIIIEKATPADALALLKYLKRIGGETDNLSFAQKVCPLLQKLRQSTFLNLKILGTT